MALSKTERGRNALQAQSAGGLSLPERRVLILCDGRRSHKDIVALLGSSALPMIDCLLQAGYLSSHGGTAANPKRATSQRRAATAQTIAKTPSADAPAAPGSRRSLAVSQMYLADMLQLQRDAESASLRALIQARHSEDELVYHMMKGLRHLQVVANASHARRVGDRLAEILPERYLPRLQYIRTSWLDSESAVA